MNGHGIFKFPGGGVSYFTKLLDAFASYAGLGGKVIAVKADESGLEAINVSGGGGGVGESLYLYSNYPGGL
jgi:hypothetical protein